MKKFLLIITLMSSTIAGHLAAQMQPPRAVDLPTDPARIRKIDSLFTLYANQQAFTGAVLIAKGGNILLEKAYGMADLAANTPNTPATVFRLGSITKQFTSMAIMMLEAEGKLSVQDKLSRFLPDYPNADSITLHQLLTHTSGLPSFTDQPWYNDSLKALPEAQLTQLALINSTRNLPREFAPGTNFKYCNTGYVVLAYIVAKASGMTYEQFLAERIFKPLGMNQSGYEHTATPPKGMARGYRMGADDHLTPASYVTAAVADGAGALYSTLGDMHRWDRALAAGKFISPEAYKRMYTPDRNNYAYGWAKANINGMEVLLHTGGIDGFGTVIARIPANDFVLIVLQNREGSPIRPDQLIFKTLVGIPYAPPAQRKAIELPAEKLAQYVGIYEVQPGAELAIRLEEGRLMAQATGQGANPLFVENENRLFLKIVDAYMDIERDAEGRITGLVLNQNGRKLPARKIR